ncbi:Nipped-B-like protein A [Merluccius polli]|uniref:Nipped-B-like protein A n=1 Tax=Merluccius polli TaxID=89951 RepID=A0AA47NW32_MERPO|nr:Nipped-B-like protein A [Merluccius polli]
MPQLPITTLAGISSLTDFLNHLPLPSPLPATTARSFLYSSSVAADVFHLLASRDEKLASRLAPGLSQVSTENMWVFFIYSMSLHLLITIKELC